VNARARALAECRRLDQLMLAVLQALEQTIGALGLLSGAFDDAANQEELRIVAAVQFGMDGFHSTLRGHVFFDDATDV
jgi:hypothetical protein